MKLTIECENGELKQILAQLAGKETRKRPPRPKPEELALEPPTPRRPDSKTHASYVKEGNGRIPGAGNT